ncbi:MAG: serine/threonine-protein kinase [Myxococcota bacterium]
MADNTAGVTTRLDETTPLGDLTLGDTAGERAAEQPRRLGRYVILGVLGRGGMGVVYSALDTELDRSVALKVLRHTPGRRGINAEPRLRREARALARLAHPNVVAIYDVGSEHGTVYVAMELVDGQTLTHWQRTRARSWAEIVDVYLQAGEGLAAAHRQGLVHRDFKPDNAIIDAHGRVRVLDFGLAVGRVEESESSDLVSAPADGATLSARLTMTGAVMGTPAYMAPEQMAGLEADARTDQFSFCVALFEALFGRRPFGGANVRQLRAAIEAGAIAEPSAERPVPRWLLRVVRRGLHADPSERWPDLPSLLQTIARHRSRTRMRRVIALLGGGALALGAATVAAPRVVASDDPCETVAARAQQAWGPTQQDSVREALLGSSLPYARDTWSRVKVGLDRYTEQWSEHRLATCQAARSDGDDGGERSAAFERQLGCLDGRRAELEALVDVLAEADAGVVARASEAVVRLPSIERCAVPPGQGSGSVDPEGAAEVRQRLGQAHAQELAGRYPAGLRLALLAAERADALGDPTLVAEARYRVGVLHLRNGAYPDAETSLSRAASLAVEAGEDDLAASVMVQQTGLVGYILGRHEDGLVWARHAAAAVERADSGPTERSRLWNNLGATHDRSGDLVQAREHYAQALALLEDPTDPALRQQRASTLNNLGNAQARLGNLSQAAVSLTDAVAQTEALHGPDHPQVAVILANLANVDFDLGHFERALAHHQRALGIVERALGPEHPRVASARLNLAILLQTTGASDLARPHAEQALAIKERALGPEHHETAMALNNLGVVLRDLGELDAATKKHRRALAIWTQRFGAEHPVTAYARTNLGIDLLEQGEIEAATEHLRSALELRERSEPSLPLRGTSRLALARAVDARGDEPDRARALFEAAWEELRDAPSRYAGEQRVARQWLDEHVTVVASR